MAGERNGAGGELPGRDSDCFKNDRGKTCGNGFGCAHRDAGKYSQPEGIRKTDAPKSARTDCETKYFDLNDRKPGKKGATLQATPS